MKTFKLVSIALVIYLGILFSSSTFITNGPPVDPADSVTYSIARGQNACKPTFNQRANSVSRVSYYIQFEENCKYSLGTIDSNDVNKAYGFSRGHHHQNSARLGWNWKKDTLMLYNYDYFSSKATFKKIGHFARKSPIYVEQWYQGSDTIWISCVQNGIAKAQFLVGKGIGKTEGYVLYPWFGGTSRAPNNMTINIWGVRFQ